MSFERFSFDQRIAAGVQSVGFSTPTAIQEKAIPVILEGQDVLGALRIAPQPLDCKGEPVAAFWHLARDTQQRPRQSRGDFVIQCLIRKLA